MDTVSRKRRSAIMSAVRGSGNLSTELRLAKLMRAHGLTGWRRGFPLLGKPDFVFSRLRLVLFVDGCFWHGCPHHGRVPKSQTAFWRRKLAGNKARDLRVTRTLRRLGWRVVRIWEHELARKNEERLTRRMEKLILEPRKTRNTRKG